MALNISGETLDTLPPPTASLDFGSQNGINVADPVNPQDVSSKNYVVVSGIKTVGFTLDGRGAALVTGQIAGYYTCPVAGTITAWSIGVDTGTATVETWKVATGTATPTASDNISTSGVSLSSNTYVRSTTVTDFTTTAVAKNDIVAFNLSAVASATKLTFQLELTPT